MEIANDPVNALTVDVEDYYQVESFANIVSRRDWARWESRIEDRGSKIDCPRSSIFDPLFSTVFVSLVSSWFSFS